VDWERLATAASLLRADMRSGVISARLILAVESRPQLSGLPVPAFSGVDMDYPSFMVNGPMTEPLPFGAGAYMGYC